MTPETAMLYLIVVTPGTAAPEFSRLKKNL
jgi:hypothetical protein